MAQSGIQTIEQWIQGKVGFTLTEGNINSILVDRDIAPTTDAADVELRSRELCWADALTIYISMETQRVQDGGTSESRGAAFDRDEARSLAVWLYEKWGETVPANLNLIVKSRTNMW